MGDRIAMVEQACLEMERAGIKVKRTSSLFETAPMYVLDQEPFINGVCEVRPCGQNSTFQSQTLSQFP
jgi:2-amino-4-hydroxy-6-hydroxymethyldihydropteridine diphosphokinase/dihydropteroate synthase